MFTLSGGGRWLCTEPEDSWPMAHIPSVKAAIKKDFQGAWGDRRQVCLSALTSQLRLCSG